MVCQEIGADEMNEDFRKEIDLLTKKYNVDAEMIRDAFSRQIRKNNHEEIINKCKSHIPLINKCFLRKTKPHNMFPEMNRYIKVISEQSINECHVECLVFDEHPTYWFSYQSSMVGYPGDYYLGSFDFKSINTEDILVSSLESMTQISLEEYNDAIRKYVEELITLPWYAEHYRFGGKMPTDPDWPKENKDVEQNQ